MKTCENCAHFSIHYTPATREQPEETDIDCAKDWGDASDIDTSTPEWDSPTWAEIYPLHCGCWTPIPQPQSVVRRRSILDL